ncbi:GNAT family N-acetyltransferase [Methanococcus maripaludis]|uniref:RimJ/RimL family protein N-acetyltransferase n=1 Tax=Methanococcus maripaludis TaxID=39152 RepID=A0A7J9PCP6_METMI|nr:GNAT family protein [Methanococcus maripaludis]MBA2860460.1 RimJ/RimL family protein N-acetyltransferase [Methanococcus maripaludis]
MDKRLFLRALEYDDLEFINKLRNDDTLFEFTCGNKYFISSQRDKKWIEDKIFNNNSQLYLMICTVNSYDPIGYICSTNIDYINRKAQWGGIVIGKEFSGKGYGTEAGKLLLDHLFGELGMNMVYGFWKEDHDASLRMAEKIGFQKDGLMRDYVFKKNRFHNAYICTILKRDYEKK